MYGVESYWEQGTYDLNNSTMVELLWFDLVVMLRVGFHYFIDFEL